MQRRAFQSNHLHKYQVRTESLELQWCGARDIKAVVTTTFHFDCPLDDHTTRPPTSRPGCCTAA